MDEPGNVALTPPEHALFVRLRLRNSTELGEQSMTPHGPEQPVERRSLLGVRLAIKLDRHDGEHSVNQILRSSPRSDPPRIGELSSMSERLVREDAWTTPWSFRSDF